MSQLHIEPQVKKQALLLSKEIQAILANPDSKLIGKFIALYDGKIVTGDTHEECFNNAVKKFGNSAFALAEVTLQKPVVSSLIKV